MKLKALRLGATGLVLASAATLVGGGVASAATVGGLSVNPATDSTTSNFPTVTTSAACPTGATNFIVRLGGPGLPAAGVNVVGNTSISIANPAGAGYSYALSTTMHDALQANGVSAPNGAYTLTWMCVNTSGTSDFGDFVNNLTFTHTSAMAPSEASYTSAPAATPTSITETVPATSAFGSAVTLSASVSPTAAGGTVQFMDGSTALGTPQTVTNGAASYTTSALTAGAHSITAVFNSGSATYANSTSAASTITVSQATTSVSLAGPSSVNQYQAAAYTATVTPGTVAGSIVFAVDGTTAATVAVSGGSATYTTSTLSAGSHNVTATFTSGNTNYSNSPVSNTVATTVVAVSSASVAQPVTVTVPSGDLTIAIGSYGAGLKSGGYTISGTTTTPATSQPAGAVPVVNLGTAAMRADGQFFEATGNLNPVTVTDTRAGNVGWTVSGISTDFSEAAPPAGQTAQTISAGNLGWTPSIVSLSANQGATGGANPVVVGGTVAPGNLATGTAPGTLGLATSKTFVVAHAGQGNGAGVFGGTLDLTIPTDRRAGAYNATVTFTVLSN